MFSFYKPNGPINKYLPLIKAANINGYKTELEAEVLERLNLMERLNLLNGLVRGIVLNKNELGELYKEYIDVTLGKWSNGDELVSTIGDLVSYIACEISIIKEIVKLYPDILPIELIESQTKQTNGLTINYIIDRVRELYPEYNVGAVEMRYLSDRAASEGNTNITAWVAERLNQVKERQVKPDWVTVEPNETPELLDYKNWEAIEESCAVTATDLEEELSNFNIRTDEGEELDEQEIQELVGATLAMTTDKCNQGYPGNPDRMFGPVNRRPDADCVSGVIKGGCRMLTCRCRDYEEDEDEHVDATYAKSSDGWFVGKCDQCRRIIIDISYALRFPPTGGSWVGCYCSLECLNKAQPQELTRIEAVRFDELIDSIEDNGIIDRLALTGNQQDNVRIRRQDLDDILIQQASAIGGFTPDPTDIKEIPTPLRKISTS